ncbi:MAG: ATP synthase F1 subunit gamma [Thermoflexales bacterium]|nr:ATP synthase F1 subunit gamma [Thermoflexales bacterium]
MSTTREFRRRIKSVKNIAQITRAMEAVSASRVRRAQEQVLATRPYARLAWEVLSHLASQPTADGKLHRLLEVRPKVDTVGVVLLTSDRGLCGAFNHNIVRTTESFIKQLDKPAKLITVGRKGRELMWRRHYDIMAEFSHLPAAPGIVDIAPIARTAIDAYLSNTVDQVYLAYTVFVNRMRQEPAVKRLLPLRPTKMVDQAASAYLVDAHPERLKVTQYIYEPSPQVILDTILPRFTVLQIYQAILESLASEHSARMVAMRNATDNALSLIDDLTIDYNKARQQGITSELLDIAGGAEALQASMR